MYEFWTTCGYCGRDHLFHGPIPSPVTGAPEFTKDSLNSEMQWLQVLLKDLGHDIEAPDFRECLDAFIHRLNCIKVSNWQR